MTTGLFCAAAITQKTQKCQNNFILRQQVYKEVLLQVLVTLLQR